MDLYSTTGTFTPDNLIAGNQVLLLTKAVKLKAARGMVKRGTVLGIITAGGLAVAVDSSKADGSQTADCILAKDADTGAAGATEDVVAEAYRTGHFNCKALIFGGADDAGDHEATLRDHGMYLSDNIAY